jgi:hypothetical protein
MKYSNFYAKTRFFSGRSDSWTGGNEGRFFAPDSGGLKKLIPGNIPILKRQLQNSGKSVNRKL